MVSGQSETLQRSLFINPKIASELAAEAKKRKDVEADNIELRRETKRGRFTLEHRVVSLDYRVILYLIVHDVPTIVTAQAIPTGGTPSASQEITLYPETPAILTFGLPENTQYKIVIKEVGDPSKIGRSLQDIQDISRDNTGKLLRTLERINDPYVVVQPLSPYDPKDKTITANLTVGNVSDLEWRVLYDGDDNDKKQKGMQLASGSLPCVPEQRRSETIIIDANTFPRDRNLKLIVTGKRRFMKPEGLPPGAAYENPRPSTPDALNFTLPSLLDLVSLGVRFEPDGLAFSADVKGQNARLVVEPEFSIEPKNEQRFDHKVTGLYSNSPKASVKYDDLINFMKKHSNPDDYRKGFPFHVLVEGEKEGKFNHIIRLDIDMNLDKLDKKAQEKLAEWSKAATDPKNKKENVKVDWQPVIKTGLAILLNIAMARYGNSIMPPSAK